MLGVSTNRDMFDLVNGFWQGYLLLCSSSSATAQSSLLMDSDDSCCEAHASDVLAENAAFWKQRDDNIARRKQREFLLIIAAAPEAVHASQANRKKSLKRAPKSEPVLEPRRCQRSKQPVSYREQELSKIQGARPQLLLMAEAASPLASDPPTADPAPTQADLLEKYFRKAAATVGFYQATLPRWLLWPTTLQKNCVTPQSTSVRKRCKSATKSSSKKVQKTNENSTIASNVEVDAALKDVALTKAMQSLKTNWKSKIPEDLMKKHIKSTPTEFANANKEVLSNLVRFVRMDVDNQELLTNDDIMLKIRRKFTNEKDVLVKRIAQDAVQQLSVLQAQLAAGQPGVSGTQSDSVGEKSASAADGANKENAGVTSSTN